MLEAYVTASVVLIGLLVWGIRDVGAFFKAHPRIEQPADLDAFKALARRNMIAALFGITLVAVWILLAIVVSRELQWHLKVLTFGVMVPVSLLSIRVKRVETAARNLPCSPSLEAEYRRVGDRWQHKALPDF